MRHHVRTLLPVLLAWVALPGVVHAASQKVDIAKAGKTSLRAALAGKTVEITFHTARLTKSTPGFPSALDDYSAEVSICQRITIVVDEKTIWVPWSAYSDLFDARRAEVRFEKGVFVLSIGGADGAYLYSAHLSFDADRVIKRTVFGAFAPNRPLEETVYWPRPVIE